MLYHRLKLTFLTCAFQMCSFQATERFEHLENTGTDSAWSIAEQSDHRADIGQRLPRMGETSGTLKRTWQDTLAIGPDPPSMESLHRENDAVKRMKQSSIDPDLETITDQRYIQILYNFDTWESGVSKLNLPDAKLSRAKLQTKETRNAIRNLFHKRIYELKGHPYVFSASVAILTGDLAASIMDQWEERWLNSVANIAKTWEFAHLQDRKEATSFVRQGIDFMIDFFIDIQKLEVVTKKRLEHFLNKEGGSRIISSYIHNRFPQPRLDVCKLYLNFNVKLSLLEGPATRKIVDLLTVLDADSWMKIELNYLKNQLFTYLDDPSTLSNLNDEKPSFKYFIHKFLVLTSQEDMEISIEKIEDFMKSVIEYLKHELNQEIAESPHFPETQSLIETKLGHDMISFFINYCRQPPETENSIMESKEGTISQSRRENPETGVYYEMRAIEEAVRFLSSVYHSIYIRITEYQNQLEHIPWEPNFLVDNNENRKFSIYGEEDDKLEECDFEELDDFSRGLQSSLSYPTVKESIAKALIQYTKYYKQMKFHDHWPLEYLESKFLSLLKHYEKYSHMIVQSYEDFFQKGITTRAQLNQKVDAIEFHRGHVSFADLL